MAPGFGFATVQRDSCHRVLYGAILLLMSVRNIQSGIVCSEQTTDIVLMIPPNPSSAVWDPETSSDNSLMHPIDTDLNVLLKEWNSVVDALTLRGIHVIKASHDGLNANTPNCLFPNNWLSTHHDTLTIYPMKWPNRRLEIRDDIIDELNFENVYNLSQFVSDELYLEGTGVLIFDREHKIAYMSVSQRASAELASIWAMQFDYKLVLFESVDDKQNAIYHTNVMMSVGSSYVIICMECIKGETMRGAIRDIIVNVTKKELIEITIDQMLNFCGNVLEVGEKVLMMSQRAFDHFTEQQKDALENKHGLELVHPSVPIIEEMHGGGVRCMIAEIFKS